MKSFIVAAVLLAFLFCTAAVQALEVEGYRVYIGPDRDVDWIDVCAVLDSSFDPIFEDKSPIDRVYRLMGDLYWNGPVEEYTGYWIFKKNSTWKLIISNHGFGASLYLVDPYIDNAVYLKLIYKRGEGKKQ